MSGRAKGRRARKRPSVAEVQMQLLQRRPVGPLGCGPREAAPGRGALGDNTRDGE